MAKKFSAPAFTDIEKTILEYLFTHPEHCGTQVLMRVIQPESNAEDADADHKVYRTTEYAVENLVALRLVKGERHAGFGDVYYTELVLTQKGEAEAIHQRRIKETTNHKLTDEERAAANRIIEKLREPEV
jgi:hypothetical protein